MQTSHQSGEGCCDFAEILNGLLLGQVIGDRHGQVKLQWLLTTWTSTCRLSTSEQTERRRVQGDVRKSKAMNKRNAMVEAKLKSGIEASVVKHGRSVQGRR
jgi:hypothetical protein